jgi:hypothetical protein
MICSVLGLEDGQRGRRLSRRNGLSGVDLGSHLWWCRVAMWGRPSVLWGFGVLLIRMQLAH